MFDHILLPTDGSDFSKKAAQGAIAFAKKANAKITAFHAIQGCPSILIEGGSDSIQEYDNNATQQGKKYLEEIKTMCADAGVVCNTFSEHSDTPYEAIIQAAEECRCDLIFMASHGRRGLSHIFIGDATTKVTNQSKIPVLVFRV